MLLLTDIRLWKSHYASTSYLSFRICFISQWRAESELNNMKMCESPWWYSQVFGKTKIPWVNWKFFDSKKSFVLHAEFLWLFVTKIFFMSQNDLPARIFIFLPIWTLAEKCSYSYSGSLGYAISSLAYLHMLHFICMRKSPNINTVQTVVSYVKNFIYFPVAPCICICLYKRI